MMRQNLISKYQAGRQIKIRCLTPMSTFNNWRYINLSTNATKVSHQRILILLRLNRIFHLIELKMRILLLKCKMTLLNPKKLISFCKDLWIVKAIRNLFFANTLYRYRWMILFIFCLAQTTIGLVAGTCGVTASIVKEIYGLTLF